MVEHGGRCFISRRELILRGWRKRDIIGHLTPVKTINPDRPKGCLLNMYDLSDVEDKEEFLVSLKVVEDDKDLSRAIRWANRLPIHFTKNVSMYALAESLDLYDSKELLAHFRHNFSNYEKMMDLCDTHPFPRATKRVLRLRLLRMVTKSYQALRPGATLQWQDWYPNEDAPIF